MKQKIFGATLVSIAAILWGFDGIVLTPRLYNLNVPFVVLMIHLIPFLIMNIFMFKEYRYLKKFKKPDFINFFLIALFGGSLGTLAIVKALFLVNFDHLSIVVLLQKTQPIFAIFLAWILLKEKIKKRFIAWAGVAVVATYFLAFGVHLPNFQNANTQAAIWAIIAAFSFGSATVFGKAVLKKFSFHTANFYRFGFTSIIMLIYVGIIGKFSELSAVTSMNWLIFIIIAFTTGSGAIFIYYLGLKKISAHVSTICELMFPISAIYFDFVFNGTTLSPAQWLSSAVLIYAIIHISKTEK